MSVAEDAAVLLADFVSSLDNLPSEVHHILQASKLHPGPSYLRYANNDASFTGDWSQGSARV